MTDRTAVPWEELYRAGPCVYPSSKELPTVLADFIDQLERLDLSFSKIEESEKHTAIIALLSSFMIQYTRASRQKGFGRFV
mmetsp:Transcript_46344/g.147969  ORF Transcript_46344/g.147969 Transcript_46344/m.147969 type:complete len:81 (-) Transcript_46344:283-525(-)